MPSLTWRLTDTPTYPCPSRVTIKKEPLETVEPNELGIMCLVFFVCLTLHSKEEKWFPALCIITKGACGREVAYLINRF